MSVPAPRGAKGSHEDGALVASPSRAASYPRAHAQVKQIPQCASKWPAWTDEQVWCLGAPPDDPRIQRARERILEALATRPFGMTSGEIDQYVLRSKFTPGERESALSSLVVEGRIRLRIAYGGGTHAKVSRRYLLPFAKRKGGA